MRNKIALYRPFRKTLCCLLLLVTAYTGYGQDTPQPAGDSRVLENLFTAKNNANAKDLFATHSYFIENIGQYGNGPAEYSYMGNIKYGFQGFAMPVLFTPKGIILLENKPEAIAERERDKLERKDDDAKNKGDNKNATHITTMQWVNANPNPQIIAEEETASYFTFGSLAGKAKGFKKITYKDLYPGIDVTYYFDNTKAPGFEYSLTVHPGAELASVKMLFGGDLKTIQSLADGSIKIKTGADGFKESSPVSFYEDDITKRPSISFHKEKNIISFSINGRYDTSKTLVIDPFISSTSNLLGLNAGKAKDIDYDYAGNLYVSGGGDGATNHMLAKYDANGVLQWTFSGILANPSWQFGTYYGGWVVEKTTGNVYLGQGFEYTDGFSVIRLNTAGIYDNYITTANPNFREDWKMYWMCNNGSPQILIAGGGTNSNTNFGICTPPSTTISSLNITGIPYTGADGWAQDISDIVIDPVTNDMYTIYGSLYGTPSLSNKIYKNKAPYSSASIQWNLYSGFIAIQEIANRPFLAGSSIDNSSNVLAINSSYFYYWDGKNLKAFDKATGATVGAPLTIAANLNLMSGGIIADECNNIFVGSTNGVIKVYKFNGSSFDDAAQPDIAIPGYSTKSVYDLSYNESQKLLYASGDGFIASFDISSYGCPSTLYTINVNANCAAGTATVTLSPSPPLGSTVTYVLFNGNTQITSNTSGVFTGLSAGITYTVKVYVNQVCSGTLTVTNFVLPGPLLALTKTDATCGNATGGINAIGSAGAGPYTYSKDGITFQASGSFTGLTGGLYIITVKDAGGCKTTDSIIIKNTNGPAINFTKSDATCSNNDGVITASGSGGTPPLQYSINGITFQTGTIFTGLAGGNYTLTVKDAGGCTNAATVTIADFPGPQLTATPTASTCNNSNGSIFIFGTGTAPLQYSINGNIFQANNVFVNLAAGNYTVTVMDAKGCTKALSVTVASSPGPLVTAVATIASCNNSNGSITANGTSGVDPLQYSINGISFQTGNIFTGLAAGTYTITVKDANGCTNTTSVTVNNSTGPTVTVSSSGASCNTSTGTITVVAGGAAPFQYSITGFTFQFSNVFTGLPGGNYIVYVKDAAGCISTTTITINNIAGPQVTAVTTATSCTVNNGTITATGTGGTGALQYSIDGVAFQAGNFFSGLAEGAYTVFVKDANGCIQTTTVDVANASGLALTASSISTTCAGNNGSITATATGGVTPLLYSINGVTFQSSNLFNGLTAGVYTITVKDANNCLVKASVIVNASSGLSITVVTSNSCSNKNGSINAAGSGGTAPLTYSINGVTFQASGFFYGLTPGTYTVTVKDANSCITTTSATISNVSGAGPTVTAKFHDAHACNGDGPQGRIDNIAASGGKPPYLFSVNGGPFTSTTTYFVLPGVYTVTVMDANGCTSTVKGTIVDIAAPTVTAISTPTPCGLSTGTIKATGHGGSPPYRYSLNGGPFQSSGTFTGLAAGTYTIRVIDDEDCVGSVQVTVLNTGGPTVSTIKTDGNCGLNNGTITATGTGGTGTLFYSINGSGYQASGVFTGLAAGTYNITVRDATGCTGGTTVIINNPGGPAITAVVNAASCNIDNGSIVATVTGGTNPIKYSIDGTIFQGTGTFSNLSPGNYTITVLDGAGCFGKTTVNVGKTALPGISAYTIPASCNGNDGSIVATGSSGLVPYTFSIDGIVFQSSNIFTGLSAGPYTVTIRDANGCTNTTGIIVNNSSGPQLSLTATPATCANNNGTITATGTGGVAPLQYSIDGKIFQATNIFSGISSGTYTISVKDANNCLSVKSIFVGNINGAQQLTAKVTNATCGNGNGTITATATGGVAPLQYSIDGVTYQAGNVFAGLPAATYTITVKDANGCTKTTNATIVNLAAPTIATVSFATSCNKTDGIIIISASGGTVPLQYSINGITFQNSKVFSGLPAATYTVSVKDASGCTSSTSATVNNSTGATVSASAVAASCGSANGSITATASGGTAPFQYSIDGITYQASNVFAGLAAATYTVSVKDANGCTSSTSVTVNNVNGATVSAISTSSTCNTGNGTITATANGGTAPFQYSIDGITYQSGNVFAGLTAATYTVSVKDASGCISSSSVTVNNVNGATVSASAVAASCGSANGSITATASGGTAPFLYSIDGITYQSGNVFAGLTAATYTVSVKDASGCISSTSVTVNNVSGASVSASAVAASCGSANGTITATASGGTAPFQYSIDGITYQSGNVFVGLAAATYTVSVKDANGCTSSTSVTVNNVNGAAVSASAVAASCGSANGTITATASGGTAPFQYSIDGITYQAGNVFAGLAAATYTVSVKDASGCISLTSVTVNNINGATVSAISTSATCNTSNGSITATASGGTAPFQYSIDGITYQAGNVFAGLAAATYTISVKDASGCTSSTSVTVNNVNGATVSASAVAASCGGANGTITATASGGTAPFQYSIDGITYQAGNVFAGLAAATYTVSVKDASGCISSTSVTVNNVNGATVSASAVASSCGSANGTITATASGGTAPFQYSIDGSTYQAGNVFVGLAAATYTVSVKDASGCISSTSVTVNNINGAAVSASAVAASCGSANGTITATASGGTAPFQYSIDGITYQAGNVFVGLAAATYTVSVKDANGCTSSTSVTVNNVNGAAISASAVAASCGGANGSITATASGGTEPFQYSIDGITYQAGNVFAGLTAATYTVSVKDASGCISSTSVTVNNVNGATVSAISTSATCNTSNGSITATASGGTAPFQYSIDGITYQSGNVFAGLAAATYTVIVKDASGCISSTSVTVNNVNGATVSASAIASSCGSANGTITATASGGTAPFQYSIDGITYQSGNVFVGLAAATYTISVKDASGCISSTSVTVNNVNGAAVSAISTSATCNTSNGSITATASGGTAPFLYSIDGITYQAGNVFAGLAAATYTVSVKDASGCISSTSVTVNTILSVGANAGADIMICIGTTTQLNGISEATSITWQPGTWLSSPNILNPYATPPVTTTYVLTATRGACVQQDSVTIFVNPLPFAAAGVDTTVCSGSSVQLNASGGLSYTWLPTNYLSNPYIANPVVQKPETTITYIVLVADANGCQSAKPDSITVSVIPKPQVFAGNDTAVAVNQPLQLNAIDIAGSGFVNYSWQPFFGLNNPFIKNPVAVLTTDMIYMVTASTPQGCKASDNIVVKVYMNADLYVPSAFTPNGDGLNDIFKPIPVGIKEYKYFSVYNRFGQLVYATTSQEQGWDGTFKGMKQDSGTFVWQVQATDFNGNVIYKKGTVVLIR